MSNVLSFSVAGDIVTRTSIITRFLQLLVNFSNSALEQVVKATTEYANAYNLQIKIKVPLRPSPPHLIALLTQVVSEDETPESDPERVLNMNTVLHNLGSRYDDIHLEQFVQYIEDYQRFLSGKVVLPRPNAKFGFTQAMQCKNSSIVTLEPLAQPVSDISDQPMIIYGSTGNCYLPEELAKVFTTGVARDPYTGNYYSQDDIQDLLAVMFSIGGLGLYRYEKEYYDNLILLSKAIGVYTQISPDITRIANTDPVGVSSALTALFDLAMYMRRWCGVRGQYPILAEQTRIPWSKVIPTTSLQRYQALVSTDLPEGEKQYYYFEMYLTEKLNDVILHLRAYPELLALQLNASQNLGDLMRKLQSGNACMRTTSAPLVNVIYQLMRKLGMHSALGFTEADLEQMQNIVYVPEGEYESLDDAPAPQLNTQRQAILLLYEGGIITREQAVEMESRLP